MKKILMLIIAFLMLSLTSCKSHSEEYFDELKQEYKYLDDAKVVFYKQRISGFDSSGIKYMVLEFPSRPNDFLNQFFNHKEPEKSNCGPGRNKAFEEKTDKLINQFFSKEYEEIEDEFKIDWEKEYYYLLDLDDYVFFPKIYFEENCRLILIESIY